MTVERETQSLAGRWQIAFDPGNIGKQRGWMEWDSSTNKEANMPSTSPHPGAMLLVASVCVATRLGRRKTSTGNVA